MCERGTKLFHLIPIKLPPNISHFLLSPIPNLLVHIIITPNKPIKTKTNLTIIKTIKIENVLRAERSGVVKEVLASAGESLAIDQAIIKFE